MASGKLDCPNNHSEEIHMELFKITIKEVEKGTLLATSPDIPGLFVVSNKGMDYLESEVSKVLKLMRKVEQEQKEQEVSEEYLGEPALVDRLIQFAY